MNIKYFGKSRIFWGQIIKNLYKNFFEKHYIRRFWGFIEIFINEHKDINFTHNCSKRFILIIENIHLQ